MIKPLSLILLLLVTTQARAEDKPSAREVIDAYLKEVGGRAALENVKSQRTTGTMTFTNLGQKATFELLQARPAKLLLTTDLAGVAKLRDGYDGKVGWSLNPVTGAALTKGEELEQKAELADLSNDLREGKNYKSMENLGEVTFDKKKCWKLKFVLASGAELIEYYDVKAKLRVGSERDMRSFAGKTVRVITTIQEYKAFGKLKHMSQFKQVTPDEQVSFEINAVEYDKVDEKAFTLPAEIQALLKRDE